MTLGASIALIVIGAILAFAVDFQVAGVDIQVIGYILMLGGLVGAILTVALSSRRDRYVERDVPARERYVERDRDVY